MNYTIRITEPDDAASIVETKIYTLEETDIVIARLIEKLHFNGVTNYTIAVVDQSTGETVRTTRRTTHSPIPSPDVFQVEL